ncbi:MAG: Fic family protein [Pseudomonadota bacterium]
MISLPDVRHKVDTARFGPFTFETGIDAQAIILSLQRVEDAHRRFIDSPLSQVASQLEREVIAGSVFGTNTIEGGTLSEEETAQVLEMDPAIVQQEEQRRAVNIKAAYRLAQQAAMNPDWRLSLDFIHAVHAAITQGLSHPRNQPGVLRDNAKDTITYVGDSAHGGRYKPPQYGGDIQRLLEQLVQWHNQLCDENVPALVRAPLVHFYYELIHPFWDGNGRVGRVLEATVLQAAGYRYAPFAMARYYLEHIDRYFTLFNQCRKEAEKGADRPNTAFVQFHLEGMLTVVNRLHDRVNAIVSLLLFKNQARELYETKEINARQYTILSQIMGAGRLMSLSELRAAPWYRSLYLKRSDKTGQRDLRGLLDRDLIYLDQDDRLRPGYMKPA